MGIVLGTGAGVGHDNRVGERFALAISSQSGCAGAALWRRKSGETLKKMITRFPYWLCRNAWKFSEQEDDLPVDQHMLLR